MRLNLIKALLLAGLATFLISTTTITPVIDLVDFKIVSTEKKVNISWETKFELNVRNFYIERAINDGDYKRLGAVNSNGNSTELRKYNFRDQFSEEFSGKAHYRLMLQDAEGHCSRSISRSIVFK